MTLVKICGITEIERAVAALEAGADMLGFVFAPSRRQAAPEVAREIIASCRDRFPLHRKSWRAVGVFANQPLSFVTSTARLCGLDVVQLSGEEPPEYSVRLAFPLYRTVHLSDLECPVSSVGLAQSLAETLRALKERHLASRLLLDSGGSGRWGGTGQTFDWRSVGPAARDCIVAGGLNPSNVGAAIAAMQPWAVDVSSGVETGGRKDPVLIRRFITEVRRSDSHAD